MAAVVTACYSWRLIVSLLFVTVVPAAAQAPGPYLDPLGALLLFPFAVAATITGGVATLLAAPFTYPYDYPYSYSYSYPYPYTYPSLSPYSYPYGNPYAYAAPAAYVEATAPVASYWYYCASARTYYPYISTCPEDWMRVVPKNR
jgi:hypothetical protein